MKNTNFKQNSFETEVNCPEKAFNFTTEPLQGSMMVYSGHCPHTKCLRHFSMGLTTNRFLRDLAPMCLRHNGALRLTSGGDTSRRYDKVVEISGIRFGRGISRRYDKVVEISGIRFRRDASHTYDKVMEISGIRFGRGASRRYDKVVVASGVRDGPDGSV